jgi:hypothetical protein
MLILIDQFYCNQVIYEQKISSKTGFNKLLPYPNYLDTVQTKANTSKVK